MSLVPPFPYFGGKMRLAEAIVAHFPAHDRYVEPFAGSLAVLFAKTPEAFEVVNDIDGRLMRFWRTLRERGDELEEVCALTPHSRAEYSLAKKGPEPDDDIENARQLWVLYCQSISGSREGAGWRAPGPTRKSPGQHFSRFHERFAGLQERLAHVSLENVGYHQILTRFANDEGTLLYVDPPYLSDVRSGGEYVHDMSTPEEHQELLEFLVDHKGPVVLSGYASDLYDSILEGWTQVSMETWTQSGQGRTETIYMNRTPPEALFGLDLGEFP